MRSALQAGASVLAAASAHPTQSDVVLLYERTALAECVPRVCASPPQVMAGFMTWRASRATAVESSLLVQRQTLKAGVAKVSRCGHDMVVACRIFDSKKRMIQLISHDDTVLSVGISLHVPLS